mgnify:FL=1
MRTVAGILVALCLLMLQLGLWEVQPPQTQPSQAGAAQAATPHGPTQPLRIYVFWQEGCPYCAAARHDLDELFAGRADIALVPLELGGSPETDALFTHAIRVFGFDQAAVPLVVMGDHAFLGYLDQDRSAQLYGDAVAQCQSAGCPDLIADLSRTLSEIGRAHV